MVYLFYSSCTSVDLAQHGLFRAIVGQGGINEANTSSVDPD